MSRANKPKDNEVVERFIRTLKEHKINDRTLQEEFFHQIEEDVKRLVAPKLKRKKDVLPLRDPLSKDLYLIFINNAGIILKHKEDLRQTQLRISSTILYYVGLRINKI